MTPARRETLRFRIDLDRAQARKHRTAIAALTPHFRQDALHDGDTLKLDYSLDVTYFGEVVAKLEALVEILEDDELSLAGDLEELLHGRSLIEDVFGLVDQLAAREASR